MEVVEDAIVDELKGSTPMEAPAKLLDENQDTIASNLIENAAASLKRCSIMLEKAILSGSLDHYEADKEKEKIKAMEITNAQSNASETFDQLIQSFQNRLDILTSINFFLCRAKKMVDENCAEMTAFQDDILFIDKSFLLIRSLRNKIQNNCDDVAEHGFRLLEQLHFLLHVVTNSSRRSLTNPEDDFAQEIIVYEEKVLRTDMGIWSKSQNMINTLFEKSEKLTSNVSMQKVFSLGRELLKSMSKAVKVSFDGPNKSKDVNEKIEKQTEQYRLCNEERNNQEAESVKLTRKIFVLQESQKKLEETFVYYQELEEVLLRSFLDDEKPKEQEPEQSSKDEKIEPLRETETDETDETDDTDDTDSEKARQQEIKFLKEKLREQKAAVSILRKNIQELETKAFQLETIKEDKLKSNKRERMKQLSLEGSEQSEEQVEQVEQVVQAEQVKQVEKEHYQLTSSEQVQDTVQDTSSFNLHKKHEETFTKEQGAEPVASITVSHMKQRSNRPMEVQRGKRKIKLDKVSSTTIDTGFKVLSYYQKRSYEKSQPRAFKQRDTAKDESITPTDRQPESESVKHPPSSPESALGSINVSSLIEMQAIEKTKSQEVLMEILTQLKEMKAFVVGLLTDKEMLELAKQLGSSGYCQKDADREQTIRLSSPSFIYVLAHIQAILSDALLSAASAEEGKNNMITLARWTAIKANTVTVENNFANLFKKYQDLWVMYFQLRGKLKNEYEVLMIRRKQKLRRYNKEIQFQLVDGSAMSYLQGMGVQTQKSDETFSNLNMDLPESWNEDLQNIQEAFAEGGIDRDTYMEPLVLMLKLAAVLQQKQALLGEGFMMERLKQSLAAKVQKIIQAVSSEDFPLSLLMKDAGYDNYIAFLQQMNEEDKKIRLEQEKLLLFMKLENVYKKIKERRDRRKPSVNTMQSIPEETQEALESPQKDFAQFEYHLKPTKEKYFSVDIVPKKNRQMRLTQSLPAHLPTAAQLGYQASTFSSFSRSGIPKVISSLTEIQTQGILEEAEEVQDMVSEKLASEEGEKLSLPETVSEEGEFFQLQKFDQEKLTMEEFTGAASPVLEITLPKATLPHLRKKTRKHKKLSSPAEMVSTVHTVLSEHRGFKLPLQRPLSPLKSLMLTLPPMPTLPTEKGPCPKKVRTVRYSLSSKALTSVPSHTSHFHRRKEEYVIPHLSSSKTPFPQIHLNHKQLKKVREDLLAPSLSNSQKRLSCTSIPEFTPRSPQKQALASYPDQIKAHTQLLQKKEHEFSSLKQEALGDHRDSPAGSESKVLPEEKKQVSLPLSGDKQSIFPLDQPSTTTESEGEVSHQVKVSYKNDGASLSDLPRPSSSMDPLQSMELHSDKQGILKKKVLNTALFPEILPDPVTHYQTIRHFLLHKKILSEIHLKHEQLKKQQKELSKRLPCPSSSHSGVGHEISPELASNPPQMDSNTVQMQTLIKDLHMQIMSEATVQRLPQYEASTQHLILNVKKWIHQIEENVEERQNRKPATLPPLSTDLSSFKDLLIEESESEYSLSSSDFEYNLKPGLPENESVSLSLEHENKLGSVSPKHEGTEWSTTHMLQTLSEDSDDRDDLSDSSLREMTAFCTEVPLLFYLDVNQSRRKASRILNLMVCQDLTKIPTEPCCQHLWNKFLSEQ